MIIFVSGLDVSFCTDGECFVVIQRILVLEVVKDYGLCQGSS